MSEIIEDDGKDGNQPSEAASSWGDAAMAGVVGGTIAGLIVFFGTGKLGFGAFVVFFFTMMVVKGGSRKNLAMFLFTAVGALVAAVLSMLKR